MSEPFSGATPPVTAEEPSFANNFFGSIGAYFLGGMQYLGGTCALLMKTFYWAFLKPFTGKRVKAKYVFAQMERVGFKSIPIVFLVILFIGMIIALQMAYVLRQFGVIDYVASVISIAMIRELGPLLTGIVMAGFAGASIAAELGTMRDREEILALETIGLNPIGFLVVPRLLATMIMLPCLTVLADLVGIFGGYLVSTGLLKISSTLFYKRAVEFLVFKDIYTGFIKSVVFGMLVALISCYEGFKVEGGAEGVGRATTRSVVISIVSIIGADCFFTGLFYFVLEKQK